MDTPMDGRTDAWMGTGVALFGCGDGCLGWSGFSAGFSTCAVTGGSSPGGISAPPFCFCFGGGGLCADRFGFVVGSCITASVCLSGFSTFGLTGMDVWTDVWIDGWTNGMMDGRKDDRRIDGSTDTPTDGRTDVRVRVAVAFFNCGDGCLGWSGFSACSFSTCAVTGGSSPGGSSPSPFCFCFGGGGLCAGRFGFVVGSCITASACLSGFSTFGLTGMDVWTDVWIDGWTNGTMDGRKDDRWIDGSTDTPTDGRTDVWVRVAVAFFNCGDGCLGWSCSTFSAGKATGCFSPGGSSAPSSFCFRLVTLGGGGLWAGRIGFVVDNCCFTGSACFSVSSGFSTLSSSVSFDVVALGGGLESFLSSCLGIVASGGGLAFMEGRFKGGGLSGFTSSSLGISGGGVAFCTSGEDCPGLSGSFSISAGAMIGGGEGVVIGTDGFLASGGLSHVFSTLSEGLISVDGGGDGEGFCLMGGLPGEKPANASALASVSPGGSSAPSSFCFCCATLGGGGLWAGLIGFVVGVSCFTAST